MAEYHSVGGGRKVQPLSKSEYQNDDHNDHDQEHNGDHDHKVNFPPKSWNDVRGILHHKNFHYLIIGLVILDLLLVFAELILALNTECKPDEDSFCESHLDGEKPEIVMAEKALFYSSLSILCFFVLEILTSIAAFGISYLTDLVKLFDMIIVFGSLFMEIYFKVRHIHFHGTNALVILRIWKIVRAMHAVAHAIELKAEQKIHRLESSNKDTLTELRNVIVKYSTTPGVSPNLVLSDIQRVIQQGEKTLEH